MIQRQNTHRHAVESELPDHEEASDIPRRLRLSSREISVAVALTLAALVQLVWSLTKPDDVLTAATPNPAAIDRQSR